MLREETEIDGVYEGTNDGSYVLETWRKYTAGIDSVLCMWRRRWWDAWLRQRATVVAAPRNRILIVLRVGTVVVKS
jgi:hypothetical protein